MTVADGAHDNCVLWLSLLSTTVHDTCVIWPSLPSTTVNVHSLRYINVKEPVINVDCGLDGFYLKSAIRGELLSM